MMHPKIVPCVVSHIMTVPRSLFFIQGQVAYLQSRGFQLNIISSPGVELGRFAEMHRVNPWAVNMERKISPARDVVAIARLIRVLRTIRPRIVHAHTPKGGLLGMLASAILRTPIRIYHIRGLPYMTESGPRRSLLKLSEKVSCALAHEVFCVSHSIRNVAITDGLVASEKIHVFLGGSGNGVDADRRFNPASYDEHATLALKVSLGLPVDAPVVGFVGRMVKDKGVEELALAWQRLRRRYPSLWLIVIGPEESKGAISQVTREQLNNDSRVVLLGDLPDTAPYYSLFDVLALPTYREGFPNVVLEASAMQLPVVATAVPGCTDAVDDDITGTLVPPGDATALEEAIARYLDDPDLRHTHGSSGRARVLEEFRQEDIWEAIFQAYRRLLESKGFATPIVDSSGAGIEGEK